MLLSIENLIIYGSINFKQNFAGSIIRTRKIYTAAVEIELPSTYNLHFIVHVSYISNFEEPVSTAQATPHVPLLVGGEEKYIVENIVSHRTHSRKTEYLVKWREYDAIQTR